VVQDKAGLYAEAIRSLNLYLLAAPNAPDTEKTKSLIYEIEYRRDKAAKEAQAAAEKRAEEERRNNPPREAKLGDVWMNPADGAEMVYVPAGEFVMGYDATNPAYADERPRHRVYLDAYWIDKNLVTVAQYRKFCRATGRAMPPAPDWGWKDDHPIVNVTWYDAAAYAAWAGKRLPTEAEWEKAARGTDARLYPWGNAWDASACANSANSHSTQPVGTYPSGASPYGALDMAGNICEWCADWYDGNYYQSAPARNPTGPVSGDCPVQRGGSWRGGGPSGFRCAFRERVPPALRCDSEGFRCARGPG
jgi:formylglycine-generating enzyme required for sulfatase activity